MYFSNLFSDVKKHINLKGYFFVVFLFILYVEGGNRISKYIENISYFYYSGKYFFYTEQFMLLIFLILIYKFIFKEKISLSGKNTTKFLINNIIILGVLIYLSGYINKLVNGKLINALENTGYFKLFQLNLFQFLLSLKDCFIMLAIFSGVLVFIGRKNICVFEGIKIFYKSVGIFFTFIFFWLFNSMHSNMSFYMRNFSDFTKNTMTIEKILLIFNLLIEVYFIYVCFIIALAVFKNYFAENRKIENSETAMSLAFEKTLDILKKNKIKFYGKIFGAYILGGITVVAGILIFYSLMSKQRFYISTTQIYFYIILFLFFAIVVTNLLEVFIIKICFKFMNVNTEKLDFSKFKKIFGGTILMLIISSVITSGITVMIEQSIYLSFYTNLKNALENFTTVIITLFSFFLIFVTRYFQIMFLIYEEKDEYKKQSSLKKGFNLMFKFFSWKFALIVMGINLLSSYIVKAIENFKNNLVFYPDTIIYLMKFMTTLTTIFIIFLTTQIFLLFIVNYFIEEKK